MAGKFISPAGYESACFPLKYHTAKRWQCWKNVTFQVTTERTFKVTT